MLEASHRLPPDLLPTLFEQELERVGFRAPRLYLAELSSRFLVPFPSRGDSPLAIDGTLAGLAFRREQATIASGEGDAPQRLWVPARDGVERLGVLRIDAAEFDDPLIQACDNVATLLALLVLSKTEFGDAIAVARRVEELSLAAELRLAMSPPLYFSTPSVSVACATDPTYRIAGDAFDYGMYDGELVFAIFDAMGHGLEAARMANLAVASFRHQRRAGQSIEGIYAAIDQALNDQFGGAKFVTGQIARLDVRRGSVELVNAGHPPPFVLRDGSIVPLRPAVSYPLGLDLGAPDIVTFALESRDRLVLYTDGLIDARSADGEPFGIERLRDVINVSFSEAYSPGEAARRLMVAVRTHQARPPDDDSTIMLVSWYRPEQLD